MQSRHASSVLALHASISLLRDSQRVLSFHLVQSMGYARGPFPAASPAGIAATVLANVAAIAATSKGGREDFIEFPSKICSKAIRKIIRQALPHRQANHCGMRGIGNSKIPILLPWLAHRRFNPGHFLIARTPAQASIASPMNGKATMYANPSTGAAMSSE